MASTYRKLASYTRTGAPLGNIDVPIIFPGTDQSDKNIKYWLEVSIQNVSFTEQVKGCWKYEHSINIMIFVANEVKYLYAKDYLQGLVAAMFKDYDANTYGNQVGDTDDWLCCLNLMGEINIRELGMSQDKFHVTVVSGFFETTLEE